MSGNTTLLLSSPTNVLDNSSVLNVSVPPPLLEWETPTFTIAARFRVVATLVLFVFAAVSNLSVLLSVTRGRGRRLASHLRPLIASLATADLVMTFVVMPLDAVWNVTVQWYAGDAMCKLMCFLKLFAMHSAAFILVVVSLDRHHAILHPLDTLDAGRRNRKMLLTAWILSLLLASPQVSAALLYMPIQVWTEIWNQIVTKWAYDSHVFDNIAENKCQVGADIINRVTCFWAFNIKYVISNNEYNYDNVCNWSSTVVEHCQITARMFCMWSVKRFHMLSVPP